MMTKPLLLFTSLLAAAHSQFSYDNPRPDITFDDHNDRYDISPMMHEDRLFREHADDNRRYEVPSSILKALFKARRSDGGDFAYHDTMADDGGTASDFEENLKPFQRPHPDLRRLKQLENLSRGKMRRMDADDDDREISMQYAVPIDLKLHGYLKP